jgi:hypothetical protein
MRGEDLGFVIHAIPRRWLYPPLVSHIAATRRQSPLSAKSRLRELGKACTMAKSIGDRCAVGCICQTDVTRQGAIDGSHHS